MIVVVGICEIVCVCVCVFRRTDDLDKEVFASGFNKKMDSEVTTTNKLIDILLNFQTLFVIVD